MARARVRMLVDAASQNHRCFTVARPLTGSWSRGRTKRYAYYHCAESHFSTRKEKLEGAYLESLTELAPTPEFMKLFRAVVLDVWRNRHDAARKLAGKQDRRVRELERRKARLEEAFLYEDTIDRATYQKHSDRLSEERALALMEKHDHELEGLDVEALLNYAEFVAANPGRLWQEASPEQRRRLQTFLVPTGVTWDGERIGTGVTGLFFSRLRAVSEPSGSLVALRGIEPRFDG